MLSAGCLEPSVDCEKDCDPTPTLPVINFPFGVLQLDDCRGFVGYTGAAPEKVRALVPRSFDLRGDLVPTLVRTAVHGLECRRVVLNQTVSKDVGLLWITVGVVPRDNSWVEATESYFSLDMFVTDASLQLELQNFSVPSTLVRHRHADGSVPESRHWVFEGPSARIGVDVLRLEETLAETRLVAHYWVPVADGFLRLDLREHSRFNRFESSPSLLEVEGQFQSRGLFSETGRSTLRNSALDAYEAVITFNQTYG